jgi:hypothetical protein
LGLIATIITSSVVTIIILLWFFLKNPEKVEKWASIILKVGAYVNKKAERMYMSTNIQAEISQKRKELGLGGDVFEFGVKIDWIDEETAETDLKENKVVVMMKPFRSQARNLASVVTLYVPRAVLPKARNYVEQNLMKSIDYILSKSLLENNPTALQYYSSREIEEMTGETKALLETITPIHNIGRLTRIIIPEFQGLSNLFPMETNPEVQKETVQFVEAINKFETSKSSVEGSGLGVFSGEHIKMAIVPVGRADKLLQRGIENHLEFIENMLSRGIAHFFIVSSSGSSYPKQLVKLACAGFNLSLVFSEEYLGFYKGKKKKIFCSLCSK